MVMVKEKFDYDFSLWCSLRLKFGKITSGFTMTERWEAGNYHIIFWSMMSKAECSSQTPDQLLYIYSIYITPTHLATIFYKKMEQIYKNSTGLSLLNSAFDVTHQKTIWQLPASYRSVKVKPEVSFQNFKRKLHHEKTS